MIAQPERKVWHPVVWQQPPPPVAAENYGSVVNFFFNLANKICN